MSRLRFHITLPQPTGTKFLTVIPKGMRSLVIVSLIYLILDAIHKHGSGIISLLINGEIRIIPNPTDGQILTVTDKASKDGQQTTYKKSNSNVI